MSDKLHKETVGRAERNNRSLNAEIISSLESTVSIPMIGKIDGDTITFSNPVYEEYLK